LIHQSKHNLQLPFGDFKQHHPFFTFSTHSELILLSIKPADDVLALLNQFIKFLPSLVMDLALSPQMKSPSYWCVVEPGRRWGRLTDPY